MISRANTVAFHGIEARQVEVQCSLVAGLPAFAIVGLPDKAVSEARERVRAAFASMSMLANSCTVCPTTSGKLSTKRRSPKISRSKDEGLGCRPRLHVLTGLSWFQIRFNARAGANQIAIAVNIVDPIDRRPIFVSSQ